MTICPAMPTPVKAARSGRNPRGQLPAAEGIRDSRYQEIVASRPSSNGTRADQPNRRGPGTRPARVGADRRASSRSTRTTLGSRCVAMRVARSRIEISLPVPRFTGSPSLVALRGRDDPVGRVLHVEELAGRRARSPDLDHVVAPLRRLHAFADQRRDHVRALGVEVVPRPVEIHRDQVDAAHPEFLPVRLELHQERLLRDAVRRVRLLGVAGPEIVFAERDGRELRVGADRPDADELLELRVAGRARSTAPP